MLCPLILAKNYHTILLATLELMIQFFIDCLTLLTRDLENHQATIKSPTSKNINKALWLQFTVGSVPFILLTIVGYWAYGNMAFPYLLINLSGPKWAITLANVTALLQALVVFHVSSNNTSSSCQLGHFLDM